MEERRKYDIPLMIKLEGLEKEIEENKKQYEKSIDEIKDYLKEMKDDIKQLIPRVAKLEVKAGLWGGIGGLFSGIILILLYWIKRN